MSITIRHYFRYRRMGFRPVVAWAMSMTHPDNYNVHPYTGYAYMA